MRFNLAHPLHLQGLMFDVKRTTLFNFVVILALLSGNSTVEAQTDTEVMTFQTLSCIMDKAGTTRILRNSGPRTGKILKFPRLLLRARNQLANLRLRRLSLRQRIQSDTHNLAPTRKQLRRSRNRLQKVKARRSFLRQCRNYQPENHETPNESFTIRISLEGDGNGQIVSQPSGILCGAGHQNCQKNFSNDLPVTLTASYDSSSLFNSWSGVCADETSLQCKILVTRDLEISALFEKVGLPEHAKFVSPTGAGARDGSDSFNAYSLEDALLDSANNFNKERFYALLDGIYSGFNDSVVRASQHRFVAIKAGEVLFPESISLTGTYFSLEGFSLNVYADSIRNEYGVLLSGQHNQIRNCEVVGEGRYAAQHPRAESVKINGSHNTIKDCDISEAISAIGGVGSHHLISGNNLHSTTAAPIRLHQLTYSIIENNKLHNSGRCPAMLAWCSDPENNSMPEWDVSKYISSCNLSNCPKNGDTGYSNNAPHPNLLSARELDNVIIRGNMGWDGEIPTLRIRDGFGGGANGENIIIENNIFPQFYGYSGELTVRNNIFQKAQFGSNSGSSSCSVKSFALNIVGGFNYANTGSVCTNFEYQDYNLIQWQSCRSGYSCAVGPNDIVVSGSWSDLSDWDDFFIDFQGINNESDFNLKPASLPMDFGPIDRAAETDRVGKPRVEIAGEGKSFPFIADAGVYEFQ